eukprot:3110207-Amphidinium_carterae.1
MVCNFIHVVDNLLIIPSSFATPQTDLWVYNLVGYTASQATLLDIAKGIRQVATSSPLTHCNINGSLVAVPRTWISERTSIARSKLDCGR